jgi:hypothetical protein
MHGPSPAYHVVVFILNPLRSIAASAALRRRIAPLARVAVVQVCQCSFLSLSLAVD